MRYTKIPETTMKELLVNAGVVTNSFNKETGEIGDILFATTGGINFKDTPTYQDYGDDIDNCPKNTKELKRIDSREISLSGTALTVSASNGKRIAGAADVDTADGTHIVPRDYIKSSDFEDLWWIGDYSDKNGNTNGGFLAIHLINALSTDGFSVQTTDKGKGQFAFVFTGHYSIYSQSTVPYEMYVSAGTDEAGDYSMSVSSVASTTATGKTHISVGTTAGSGEGYVYQTGYSLIPPNEGTVLDGTAWTTWDGSAEIAATSGMDIVVAVISTAKKKATHAGKTVVVSKK